MKNKIIFLLTLITSFGFAQNPLLIPESVSGSEIDLNLQKGVIEYFPGYNTFTIGYNQNILGPTIILEKGQDVSFKVSNFLDEATTLHWHGLHVTSENDGGPHTAINPGEVWEPSFTVLDEAATYWYHPHLHEHTEEQVTRGAAGFIIVKDEIEASLDLPRSYGIDDFPIVVQSRSFDTDKQFEWSTAADDDILVNATLDAFLEVPAQVVRLRLLNGSTERVYNLGFGEDFPFYQIAGDGGLLNNPVMMTRLLLVPGERAEILIDLGDREGDMLNLMSYASELQPGYYGAASPSVMPMGSITGYNQNILNGNDFQILEIKIVQSTDHPVFHVPDHLIVNSPYSIAHVEEVRNLTFRPKQMGHNGMLNGPFTINGVSFDSNVVNYEIPLGSTEIWELTNMTAIAHPFHIHDVQFYVLDINGDLPAENMRGRKDVVMVPPMGGTVRFITRFDDFANEQIPYMYHCHMLSHEDEGMMGQFIVSDNLLSNEEKLRDSIYIFPNPANEKITIKNLLFEEFKIFSINGEVVNNEIEIDKNTINISGLNRGIYILETGKNLSIKKYKFVKI